MNIIFGKYRLKTGIACLLIVLISAILYSGCKKERWCTDEEMVFIQTNPPPPLGDWKIYQPDFESSGYLNFISGTHSTVNFDFSITNISSNSYSHHYPRCVAILNRKLRLNYYERSEGDHNIKFEFAFDSLVTIKINGVNLEYNMHTKELIYISNYWKLSRNALKTRFTIKDQLKINGETFKNVYFFPNPYVMENGDSTDISGLYLSGDEGMIRYDQMDSTIWEIKK